MYKILKKAVNHRYLLSWLIAFFIGGILFPMYTKASSMPVVSSQTISIAEQMFSNALTTQFLSKKLYPYLPEQVNEIIENYIGTDPTGISIDDFDVQPLENEYLTALEDAGYTHFINKNGENIAIDDLYLVNYDNGFFHGTFYCDSNGDVMYLTKNGDTLDGMLLQTAFGGTSTTLIDWEEIYQDLSEQIINNNYAYNENNMEITPQTYFYFYGEFANYRPASAHYYYCINEYNPGTIIRMPNESGRTVFYANDPDAIIYQCTLGNSNNQKSVTYGDFYFNSIHYSYKIVLPWDGNITVNNTYESWINTVGNGVYARYFANNGMLYDSNKASNAHSAKMFKPITYENDLTNAMNIDDIYAHDDLEDAVSNAGTGVYNPAFDGRNALSEENYPFDYPISTSIPASTLPIAQEDDTVYDPALTYPETIQPTPEIVNGSFENFGVPFFSNLQYRYPFSIPWDIQKFIRALRSDPEPPAWNFDYTITVGNTDYTKHFEGDLSDFNSLAELFRNLVLIGFVLALCKFSYDHHF